MFGVGASSPGVWQQHRGVVLALLEALEELLEERLEGRLSHQPVVAGTYGALRPNWQY